MWVSDWQSIGLCCNVVFPLIVFFKGNFFLHSPFSEALCCVLINFSIEFSAVCVSFWGAWGLITQNWSCCCCFFNVHSVLAIQTAGLEAHAWEGREDVMVEWYGGQVLWITSWSKLVRHSSSSRFPHSVTLSLSLTVVFWQGMRATEEVEEQWENLIGSSLGWREGPPL